MQNQDPLNPMDNAQVTSQMAQINTVSGIEKLNLTVQGLSSQFAQLQALQGASLVGHDVVVPGNTLQVADDASAQAGFELAGPADQVKVEVLAPSGQVVDTLNLGAQTAGVHSFDWHAGANASTTGAALPRHGDERQRQHGGHHADARPGRRGQHRPTASSASSSSTRAPCPYSTTSKPSTEPQEQDHELPARPSGLNASSKNLEVIGNNVANANTFGAKSSRAEFADMYANALSGGGGNNIGIGVTLAAVAQQFTQGNITSTDNPMDLAINGAGFFQLDRRPSGVEYSRNGQFKVDRDGYVVNNAAAAPDGLPGRRAPARSSPARRSALQLPTAGITPGRRPRGSRWS